MEKLYTLEEAKKLLGVTTKTSANTRRLSKVSGSSYQVRAYNIRHSYDVNDFLEAYRSLLQKAGMKYGLKSDGLKSAIRREKRLIPVIPKGKFFKNNLRNLLMENWSYSKHYVDSAIKQAYSILKSWRRNYIKGERRRKKPVVKKRFVRIKEMLYSFRNGKIRVSVKPYEEYLEFKFPKPGFSAKRRVKWESLSWARNA